MANATRFRFAGRLLASYSAEESVVKFWDTSSGLLGLSSPHCAGSWNVSRWTPSSPLSAEVRLDWASSNMVSLVRGTEQPVNVVL